MANRSRSPIVGAAFFAMLGVMTVEAQQPPYLGYGYGPHGMWQQLTPEQQRQMWESMHRWGYGPGMMGGYGRGYGMGPGMMGVWAGLDLSEAQTAQLETIHSSLREKHLRLMGQMRDERAKLAELYDAEKRDPAEIGKAYDRLSKLQREALEARIEAENKVDEVLTKEQRAQLHRRFGRGRMGY